MNLVIEMFSSFNKTGNLIDDCYTFLKHNNKAIVAEHSLKVSNECGCLAKAFGYPEEDARIAGILHDISAVFPYSVQLEIVKNYGIEILPEEYDLPLLIHQKTSQIIASDIFNIDNIRILSAIGCHTTLKENPSTLDLILFLADKLCWDQTYPAPYYEIVCTALETSLEYAVYMYMKYNLDKNLLKVVHPWYQQAYDQLHFGFTKYETTEIDTFKKNLSLSINRKHKRNRF